MFAWMDFARRVASLSPIALLILLVLAPVPVSAAKNKSKDEPQVSQADVRERLAQFYTVFVNAMEVSSSRASEKETDVDQLRQVTLAKIRAVRACRAAVFQDNVMAALVDTWGLCVQMRVYLESAAAQRDLKDGVKPIIEVARSMQARIETIASEFIPADKMAELRKEMGAFAADHPMSPDRDVDTPSTQNESVLPSMGWVLKVPLAPFRAIEGVDNAAVAVSDLAKVADNFTRTFASVPLESAWEAELLLLQVRRDTSAMVSDLDAKQAGLQSTLREVRGALSDADRIVAKIDPIVGSTERTMQALTGASNSIDQMLRTATEFLRPWTAKPDEPPPPPKPAEKEGPPFDIRDYTHAAEGLTASAAELRGLLAELNTTMASPALTRVLDQSRTTAEMTLSSVEASTRRLIWWTTGAALCVVLSAFGAALAYRRIVLRWTAARSLPA